ncbi:acyltransferase [Methylomonas montana]|uniref:acyltransferase n=1 Tax=Methylomonas montana TaxID=3058963 RepID=UPI00265B5919|nr:acyltransferase [Methylomonas montana]WKJ90124.1 acyltransferase [Methylomonas montana]
MAAKIMFYTVLRLRDAVLKRWWNFSGRLLLRASGVDTQYRTILYGYPIVTLCPDSKVIFGDGVMLCSDSRFTALGSSRPVIIRTLRPKSQITIGANTGLSGTVICSAVSVEIGSECLLGADVQIFDTDFHKIEPKNRRFDKSPDKVRCAPVVIEDNVFIGAGSKVMKGVKIGRNSVIGAGSIVTKDIPCNSIAVGNPAKVIGSVL